MDILDQILGSEMANEYSDSKGGYTKTTKTVVEIVREPKLLFDDGQCTFSPPVTAGETYEFVIDGVSYVRKAYMLEYMGETGVAIGNASALGGEDTGEPFIWTNGFLVIIAELGAGDTSEHSMVFNKIEETKTIVPFKNEYLGGVCLPVVELDTVINVGLSNAVKITDEADVQKLDNTLPYGLPIVVKIATNLYDTISGILYSIRDSSSPDTAIYSGIVCNPLGNAIMSLTRDNNGAWEYTTSLT